MEKRSQRDSEFFPRGLRVVTKGLRVGTIVLEKIALGSTSSNSYNNCNTKRVGQFVAKGLRVGTAVLENTQTH